MAAVHRPDLALAVARVRRHVARLRDQSVLATSWPLLRARGDLRRAWREVRPLWSLLDRFAALIMRARLRMRVARCLRHVLRYRRARRPPKPPLLPPLPPLPPPLHPSDDEPYKEPSDWSPPRAVLRPTPSPTPRPKPPLASSPKPPPKPPKPPPRPPPKPPKPPPPRRPPPSASKIVATGARRQLARGGPMIARSCSGVRMSYCVSFRLVPTFCLLGACVMGRALPLIIARGAGAPSGRLLRAGLPRANVLKVAPSASTAPGLAAVRRGPR